MMFAYEREFKKLCDLLGDHHDYHIMVSDVEPVLLQVFEGEAPAAATLQISSRLKEACERQMRALEQDFRDLSAMLYSTSAKSMSQMFETSFRVFESK